jgi:hypothetical protein
VGRIRTEEKNQEVIETLQVRGDKDREETRETEEKIGKWNGG